jgi:hypothetical protein
VTDPAEPSTIPGGAIITLFVGGFVVADFVAPPMLRNADSAGFAGLIGGGVAGQLGLLAIWAVFGPQRWTRRFPAALGVAVLLTAALLLGMAAAGWHSATLWAESVLALLFLPLVFLSAQLLLWIPRYVGGWRIVRAETETKVEATGSRQFHLRDVLGTTGLFAVAFSLASWGFLGEGDFLETWMPLLIGCLLCAVWNVFSALPCLWACFVARRLWTRAMVIAVCVLVMSAAVLALISTMEGRSPPAEAVFAVLMFHGGVAGVILGVLCVFRRSGYVLRRTAGRWRTTPPLSGPTDSEPTEPSPPSESFRPATLTRAHWPRVGGFALPTQVADRPRNRSGTGAAGAVLGLLAAFAAFNLFFEVMVYPHSPTVWALVLPGLLWGAVAGQLGLLAIWACLGPRRALVQLPVTMLIMLGLYGALVLGMLMAEGWDSPVRDLARGLFAPLMFFSAQSPLWVLRIVGGHRIVLRGEGPPSVESRQLRLRHLLVATALVALALGLARYGMPGPARETGPDPALVLIVACLFCALWSAFSTLPCLWAAMVARNTVLSTIAVGVYAAVMSVAVVGIIFVASSGSLPTEDAVFLFVFHGVLAAVMLGVLRIMRFCGYALLGARREERPG